MNKLINHYILKYQALLKLISFFKFFHFLKIHPLYFRHLAIILRSKEVNVMNF